MTKRQKPTGKVSDNLDDRLRSLDERLGERTRIEEGEKTKKPDSAGYSNAMRLSSEFISAILVGTGIGYLIDWLAGTSPWAMIIFLLLGFVAGVFSVLRSAGEMTVPYRSGQSSLPSQVNSGSKDLEDDDDDDDDR